MFRLPLEGFAGAIGTLFSVMTAPVAFLPEDGVKLGLGFHPGAQKTTSVRLPGQVRTKHTYIVGKTGTGKSTLLANMIEQDIENGDGVCVIDPHGDLIDTVLVRIPGSRRDDVVLFDPALTAAVMLTQLFLAARQEGYAPFPYVRACIRDGLVACASRLETINPELATQFLNVAFPEANLADRFLLSSWGTLDTRMRPLLTETVIRSLSGADFTPQALMCGEAPVTVYLRWPERDLLTLSPLVVSSGDRSLTSFLQPTTQNRVGDAHQSFFLLMKQEEPQSPCLRIRQQRLWEGKCTSGYPSNLCRSWKLSTESPAPIPSETTWRPRFITARRICRPPNILRTGLERAQPSPAQKPCTTAMKSTSEGLAERPISLLTAQAIAQLKDDEIIGFHRNLPPFRCRRMDWRRLPVLRGGRACRRLFLQRFPLFKTCRRPSGRKSRGAANISIRTRSIRIAAAIQQLERKPLANNHPLLCKRATVLSSRQGR